MRSSSLIFAFSMLFVGFISCGPALVHEQQHPFPGQWTYADSVQFQYEIQDTDKAYDLVLSVLHTDIYPTQNLYTQFVTIYPNGLRDAEPVSLELADRFGQQCGGGGRTGEAGGELQKVASRMDGHAGCS